MAQAEQLLRGQPFDLIICTIVFDESKMFDLLRLLKSSPKWQRIPFVGARVRAHVLKRTSVRSAALTCETLGAAAFLDIEDYKVEPEREMREAIERLLGAASARAS
jgi:CheY-like chemotaxis protein